jgi:NADH:ubiquinone oxidoreductase subunit E
VKNAEIDEILSKYDYKKSSLIPILQDIQATTPDKNFTLETVRCLGACALGPLMVVDGKYYGQMNAKKVAPTLKKYSKKK